MADVLRTTTGVRRAATAAVLLAAALGLGGCRGETDDGAERDTVPVSLDTAGAVSGVPRERLEEYARPMTPEEAEQEGIVDTSIFLEDASPPAPEEVRPDSVRADRVRRDTARPPAR